MSKKIFTNGVVLAKRGFYTSRKLLPKNI